MLYPYDPARAKKLLADAGFASGFPLEVYAYQLPGLPEGKTFAESAADAYYIPLKKSPARKQDG